MKRLSALLLAGALALAGCAFTPAQGDAPADASSQLSSSQEALPSASPPQAPPTQEPSPAQTDASLASSESTAAGVGTQPEPLPWWRAGLSKDNMTPGDFFSLPYNEAQVYAYFYDDVRKISYSAWDCFSASNADATAEERAEHYDDLSLLLNSAREAQTLGGRILPDHFFELVARDDTKYTGAFYEKGIELTRSLPGEGQGDSVLLALDDDDYATLQANMADRLGDGGWRNAAWLSMMRRSRMVSAAITSRDGQSVNELDFINPPVGDPEMLFYLYFYEDVSPSVESDGRWVAQTSLPDSAKVEITFNNGLIYSIFYTEDDMLVTASGVEGAMRYQLRFSSAVEQIDSYARKELNPRTGKPVIYLYPETPTDCTVTVDYPLFTYTYPKYDGGWRVTAYPDGRLINKADGTEHYYLFWEGSQRINWDFSRGFTVKGADTEAFLREKLAYMGLTPREYNDFITYWVPRMQGAAYNLITFAGEQYEALAPLTVSPKPDSVLRVHMVFKAVDGPVDIPEQVLTPFARSGFTVVEWGATDAG